MVANYSLALRPYLPKSSYDVQPRLPNNYQNIRSRFEFLDKKGRNYLQLVDKILI